MDLSTWMKWVCVWYSAGDKSVVSARRQPICLGEGSRADAGPSLFTGVSCWLSNLWRLVRKGGYEGLASKEPVIRAPGMGVEPWPLSGGTTGIKQPAILSWQRPWDVDSAQEASLPSSDSPPPISPLVKGSLAKSTCKTRASHVFIHPSGGNLPHTKDNPASI